MNAQKALATTLIAMAGLAAVIGSIAIAQPAKDAKSADQPEMQLPPGWTEDDMKAFIVAATPGKMHKRLTEDVGVWQGKTTMWMAPDTEPMKSDCTATVTAIMDGRFAKWGFAGDMPGMGPFNGLGLYGFDNVTRKFVSTWIDNQGTGIMNGTGELSPDGKTLTWKFTYNCPITKKPAVMREVETTTGPDSRKLEMFGNEPKSGKEYKMMTIEFTRKKNVSRES